MEIGETKNFTYACTNEREHIYIITMNSDLQVPAFIAKIHLDPDTEKPLLTFYDGSMQNYITTWKLYNEFIKVVDKIYDILDPKAIDFDNLPF